MCYWTALAAWMIYGKCLAWRRYACIRRWLAVVAAAGAHRWYALLAAKFCAHRRRSKQTPVECCVNDNVDDMGKQWMPRTFRKRQSASAHSTHNEPTIDFVQMTSKSRRRHRRCVIGHVWTFVLRTTIFDHRRNDEWQCQTPGCGVRYLGMANGKRMCASMLPRAEQFDMIGQFSTWLSVIRLACACFVSSATTMSSPGLFASITDFFSIDFSANFLFALLYTVLLARAESSIGCVCWAPRLAKTMRNLKGHTFEETTSSILPGIDNDDGTAILRTM